MARMRLTASESCSHWRCSTAGPCGARPRAMKRPKLSIVVPCYNEEACLEMLHARISAAAQAAVGQDYEIVLINDGSRDASWKVMQRLSEGDPRLVAINLSRNHGHQLALTAGLDLCAGEEILIIDADLQDLSRMVSEMGGLAEKEVAESVRALSTRDTTLAQSVVSLDSSSLSSPHAAARSVRAPAAATRRNHRCCRIACFPLSEVRMSPPGWTRRILGCPAPS